jgi:hypothetical protein
MRLAMAGPGQNPDSPQPIPKITEPIISGLSIKVAVGIWNELASIGALWLRIRALMTVQKPRLNIPVAANNTSAKLGSEAADV